MAGLIQLRETRAWRFCRPPAPRGAFLDFSELRHDRHPTPPAATGSQAQERETFWQIVTAWASKDMNFALESDDLEKLVVRLAAGWTRRPSGAGEAAERLLRAIDKLLPHVRAPLTRSEAGVHAGRDDVRVIPKHRLKTFTDAVDRVRALALRGDAETDHAAATAAETQAGEMSRTNRYAERGMRWMEQSAAALLPPPRADAAADDLAALREALEVLLSGHDNLYVAHFGSNADPRNDAATQLAPVVLASTQRKEG